MTRAVVVLLVLTALSLGLVALAARAAHARDGGDDAEADDTRPLALRFVLGAAPLSLALVLLALLHPAFAEAMPLVGGLSLQRPRALALLSLLPWLAPVLAATLTDLSRGQLVLQGLSRALLLLLVVLGLAQPGLPGDRQRVALVVLCDVSDSLSDKQLSASVATIEVLRKDARARGDELHLVAFADRPRLVALPPPEQPLPPLRGPGSPLAGMKAAVQLLLRGPVHDANEVSDTARALNHEIDRVELLLRRLIDYARPLSPRREHCPAERIISNASEAAAPALRAAGATLVVDLQEPLPELEVDPLLLTQALTNLLVNAAQASPPGGKVLLRAASLVRPERTQLSITVLDEGAGIAAEVKGRLFLPFFTTKPHGNGLGLAITQHILMEHEGQVRGDNRDDGRGAAFTLTLPVAPSGKEPQAPAAAHLAHLTHRDQQQAGGSGVRASLDRR